MNKPVQKPLRCRRIAHGSTSSPLVFFQLESRQLLAADLTNLIPVEMRSFGSTIASHAGSLSSAGLHNCGPDLQGPQQSNATNAGENAETGAPGPVGPSTNPSTGVVDASDTEISDDDHDAGHDDHCGGALTNYPVGPGSASDNLSTNEVIHDSGSATVDRFLVQGGNPQWNGLAQNNSNVANVGAPISSIQFQENSPNQSTNQNLAIAQQRGVGQAPIDPLNSGLLTELTPVSWLSSIDDSPLQSIPLNQVELPTQRDNYFSELEQDQATGFQTQATTSFAARTGHIESQQLFAISQTNQELELVTMIVDADFAQTPTPNEFPIPRVDVQVNLVARPISSDQPAARQQCEVELQEILADRFEFSVPIQIGVTQSEELLAVQRNEGLRAWVPTNLVWLASAVAPIYLSLVNAVSPRHAARPAQPVLEIKRGQNPPPVIQD